MAHHENYVFIFDWNYTSLQSKLQQTRHKDTNHVHSIINDCALVTCCYIHKQVFFIMPRYINCFVLSWYVKSIYLKQTIERTFEKKQHSSFIVLYSPDNPKTAMVYSDTSANEDNSFRNHIRQPKSSLAETSRCLECKQPSWVGVSPLCDVVSSFLCHTHTDGKDKLLEWPDRSCLPLYVSARIH